jgi:hypothetical protein
VRAKGVPSCGLKESLRAGFIEGIPSCGIKESIHAAEGVPSCGLYRGFPSRRNPFVQPKESPLRVQAAAVWDSWRSHSEQRGRFLAAAARSHSTQRVTRADDSWLRTTRRIPGRCGCRPPSGIRIAGIPGGDSCRRRRLGRIPDAVWDFLTPGCGVGVSFAQ